MKIVIAPDSFKGSLTAAQVCAAVRRGALVAAPEAEIISVPMADGGEGTVCSLVDALGGQFVSCETEDPLGRPITAEYGMVRACAGSGGLRKTTSSLVSSGEETAVIEMAAASGLPLLADGERDPLRASTFGTGLLIRDALNRGARDFIFGIGGSATNDGGAGMAQALGYRLLDAAGAELLPGGGALLRLARIDAAGADARLTQSRFTVACDVDNPLLGARGASSVFGPQKGASPQDVALLDAALARLAERMRTDLRQDAAGIPGSGAAGGLGAGAIVFLGAALRKGVEIVIDAVALDAKLAGADLVITGEGRTDAQTLGGKTVFGIAAYAKKRGVPVYLISGSLAAGADGLYAHGVDRMYQIMDSGVTLEEAMRDGPALLEATAARAVKEFLGLSSIE